MRLFQWRGDEIRDGSSSAGSGSDEEHQFASARVQLTCKHGGFVQWKPGQVDLAPANVHTETKGVKHKTCPYSREILSLRKSLEFNVLRLIQDKLY